MQYAAEMQSENDRRHDDLLSAIRRLEGKLGQLVERMQARRHEELPSPPEQAVAPVVDNGEQKSPPYMGTMEEIVIVNFLKPLPIHLPTNKVCIYIVGALTLKANS